MSMKSEFLTPKGNLISNLCITRFLDVQNRVALDIIYIPRAKKTRKPVPTDTHYRIKQEKKP